MWILNAPFHDERTEWIFAMLKWIISYLYQTNWCAIWCAIWCATVRNAREREAEGEREREGGVV